MISKNVLSDKKKFYFHNFKYKKEQPFIKKDSSFLFQKTKLKKNVSIRPETNSNPIVRHLPFMGTISLENLNQKPRRGRKPSPQASSIINLIQKNYGIDLSSELLKTTETQTVDKSTKSLKCEEPLNLCVRESLQNPKNKKLQSVAQRKRKSLPTLVPDLVFKDVCQKNEVSICKFKLANGSLQEKKFFSVVNGCNFNYGNATKSHQSKRPKDVSMKTIKRNESMLSIESNSKNLKNVQYTEISNCSLPTKQTEAGRGFLIQTQEQISNQCGFYKFRHLKTISRYLFRNWKNYLPPDSKVDKKIPLVN